MSYSSIKLRDLLAYGAGRFVNGFLFLVLPEVLIERLLPDVLLVADLALELGPAPVRLLQLCRKSMVVFLK